MYMYVLHVHVVACSLLTCCNTVTQYHLYQLQLYCHLPPLLLPMSTTISPIAVLALPSPAQSLPITDRAVMMPHSLSYGTTV